MHNNKNQKQAKEIYSDNKIELILKIFDLLGMQRFIKYDSFCIDFGEEGVIIKYNISLN